MSTETQNRFMKKVWYCSKCDRRMSFDSNIKAPLCTECESKLVFEKEFEVTEFKCETCNKSIYLDEVKVYCKCPDCNGNLRPFKDNDLDDLFSVPIRTDRIVTPSAKPSFIEKIVSLFLR